MSYSLPAGLSVAIMRAINDAGYELVPKKQLNPAESKCCMLSTTGTICVLERFHGRKHKDAIGHEWDKAGQPRQADPSGAASSSTTSEQPADPAAYPAYRNAAKYCNDTNNKWRRECCQAYGHAGLHESIGGEQW